MYGVNLTLKSVWYGVHVGFMEPEVTIFEQKGVLAHWYDTTKIIWLSSVAYLPQLQWSCYIRKECFIQ